jgi:hypothetical protein
MIYCPYCGKGFELEQKPKLKWYYTDWGLIVLVLCVLPFALPVVWLNPRYKPIVKIIISIVIIALTYWTVVQIMQVVQMMQQQLNMNMNF